MNGTKMKVYFRDRNVELITQLIKAALESRLGDYVEFNMNVGDPLSVPVDAVVSPANSFGFMDGGIDYHYTNFFGPFLQPRLQEIIKEVGEVGELLVGQAVSCKTDHPHIPWLIAAPTMRVPKKITDYTDIFLATRAAMHEAIIMHYNSISIPGMGTGVGKVPYEVAAKAMCYGIIKAVKPDDFPSSWREAYDRDIKWEG